jgi:hypothetical protein
MKSPLYSCDPEKNINCTKESCYISAGPCSSTTKPEYAFTNENGEPIKEDYEEEEKWLR